MALSCSSIRKQNPTIQNPTIQNPTIQNPTIQNPTIQNPTIQNPTIQEHELKKFISLSKDRARTCGHTELSKYRTDV